MTPEEFIAEAKRRGKSKEETRARYDQLMAEGKFNTEAPPEPEMGAIDTARGAIESFNRGTMFNWGDEIAGAGRAALDYLVPTDADRIARELEGDTGERPGFRETYEMYRDDQRDVQEQFAKENPKTAVGLELGGSLASPANYIGPGLQAAKGAGVLKSAATLAPRGAAEGAIAGAGATETPDEMGFGATRGAALGGAASGVLGGLGRAVSRRNIVEELGKGEEFVPIHMTSDDNLLTDLTREGLGRVGGAASKLRNQEKRFLQHADEAVEAVQKNTDDVLKNRGAVNQIEMDLARKQAQESISEAAMDSQPGLWKATEATRFDPRKMGKQLKKYYGKDGRAFQEVKDMKFDADDELIAILNKHFPDDEYAETLRDTVTGQRMMDLRNEFAIKANKGAQSKSGAEQRAFAREIDDWMKSRMPGGKKGVEAARFQDELDSYAEYRAFMKTLGGSKKNRFDPKKLAAAGKGDKRALGEAAGQARGETAEAAVETTKDQAKSALKKAKEEARVVHKRSAPKASGLSELFTTRALGGALDLGVRAATLPAGLGAGQLLASPSGQRALAGQTFWQKALQDDERAKLLAQLLRQTTSRQLAGE